MATTTTAPLTLEEFAQLSNTLRQEVSEGELITMAPPKSLHSLLALDVLEALQAYFRERGQARAIPEAGYVLSREPLLTVRRPDVSVLSKERIESTAPDDYFEGTPELAVEVVSPSHTAEDLETKVEQYLQAGSKQVWVLYPSTKRVYIFEPGRKVRVLDKTQTLEGGDLLPGFAIKVADLFPSENRATS